MDNPGITLNDHFAPGDLRDLDLSITGRSGNLGTVGTVSGDGAVIRHHGFPGIAILDGVNGVPLSMPLNQRRLKPARRNHFDV